MTNLELRISSGIHSLSVCLCVRLSPSVTQQITKFLIFQPNLLLTENITNMASGINKFCLMFFAASW